MNKLALDRIDLARPNSHTSIIAEQSIEWNSTFYITFVDCAKALDSLDRETLCKLLRHYGPGWKKSPT
jgi:hypothetical protein